MTVPSALVHLRDHRMWCVWQREKVGDRWTKVPYAGHRRKARSNDPATWHPYDRLPHGNGFAGSGIFLGDALQGVDLDMCLSADGLSVEPWAAEIVDRFKTYTEVSPSGRGVKLFLTGASGDSAEVSFGEPESIGDGETKRREIALFTGRRFFAVTGRAWLNVAVRQVPAEDLAWLRERIEARRQTEADARRKTRARDQQKTQQAPKSGAGIRALPDELLRLIRDGVPVGERSEQFFHAVRWCADCGLGSVEIVTLLESHPQGIASKYDGRIEVEVGRVLAGYTPQRNSRQCNRSAPAPAGAPGLTDFYAYLPAHRYLYVPTRELWPPESVDSVVPWPATANGENVRASRWLDHHRAVTQITWSPGQEQTIEDKVVADGGMLDKPGARVFNLYRAPAVIRGTATAAGRWRDHWRTIYGEDEADHAERWLGFKLRHPGSKVNHALVLGGEQGIGKDTLLEAVKVAIGHWNWSEVSPAAMLGRFNGWVKSVILRISEARDLGEIDRFAFYDHCKTYIAAPPDVLLCDEKNLRAYHVLNVMGVIITTNHETDGLYLPPDDRRHFVMWSEKRAEDFDRDYWNDFWAWYQHANGFGHVAEYLRSLDLSKFDPKRPPQKTAAWYEIVNANRSGEESELADLIERLNNPDALTLQDLIDATNPAMDADLRNFLTDRKNRRSVPHRLAKAGYAAVRNADAADGLWKIGPRRQTIYARRSLTEAARQKAARGRCSR